MEKFFKWLGILTLILLSLTILLVVFIIVGMGIVAVREEFIEKNKANYSITQKVYSDGRKTVESFGNKRFAIEKGVKVDDLGNIIPKEKRQFLFDRKENKDIEYDIEYYKQLSPNIYTKGEKGYTKLNYETAEIIQSKNINDFSGEDQEIFNSLEKK